MLYAQSHRFASIFLLGFHASVHISISFDFPNLRHLTITLPASLPLINLLTTIRFVDTLRAHTQSVTGQPITAFQLAMAPIVSLTDSLTLSLSIIQALFQTEQLIIFSLWKCAEQFVVSPVHLRLECSTVLSKGRY
ncbi:hypothetical protein EV421DRAFT_643983 [Armillaria borealis]|uniref:Uncharacterized protein n=1 Tax=Armillaria borealis TaxID=47425 RepID=A0AA39M5K3_9AGAR|nr:hypothetical protein EV421DRAFT_643983 [Armillaria borealis]